MADFELSSDIVVSELKVRPWAPGQEDVTLPYIAGSAPTGPVATGRTGTVTLGPVADGDASRQAAADRSMQAVQERMQGAYHRVKLLLPENFRSTEAPPDNASATLTNARIVGNVCRVTLAQVNWASWQPDVESWLNIGDRAYMVVAVEPGHLDLLPPVIPLGYRRPPGIWPIVGGGGVPGFRDRGMGRGPNNTLLVGGALTGGEGRVYALDPVTGTRKLVIDGQRAIRSLGSAYNRVWVNTSIRPFSSRIEELDMALSDPERNQLVDRVVFSDLGPTGRDRLRGLCEWQGPDDDGPKMYFSRNNELYKLNAPPSLGLTTGTLAGLATRITGPTGFTRIQGLSGSPWGLLVLDSGRNTLELWDGVTQTTWLRDTAGAVAGANVIEFADCLSVEYFDGQVLVGYTDVGTTAAGVARVNYDVPASALDVELAAPFMWARLSGGVASGRTELDYPPTTFRFVEVATT